MTTKQYIEDRLAELQLAAAEANRHGQKASATILNAKADGLRWCLDLLNNQPISNKP